MISSSFKTMRSSFFYPVSAREGKSAFAAHPELVETYAPIAEGLNCEISRYVDTGSIDWRPNVTRISVGSDYSIKFWGGDITDIRPVKGDAPAKRVFELQQKIVSVSPRQSSIEPANANRSEPQQQDYLNECCLNQSPGTYADGLQKDGRFITHSIRPNTGSIDIISWGFDRHNDGVEKIYARAKNGAVDRLLGRPYKYFRIDRETLDRFYTPANPPQRSAEIIPFSAKQDKSARLES